MKVTIQDIPTELVIQTFTHLDHCHVLRCAAVSNLFSVYVSHKSLIPTPAQVCKSFNAIVQGSHKLLYKIELAFDGLVDLPQSEFIPTYEKLQLLLNLRKAWRTLSWSCSFRLSISGSCRAYELVSGVFAKSIGSHIGHGSRHFIMSTLPSRKHPKPRFTIRDDVGVLSKDFVIDPTQDLICYVSESASSPPFMNLSRF